MILFGVFAFDVSSHPLTPFFVLTSVVALAVFVSLVMTATGILIPVLGLHQ